jgi:hypothetical protein
LKGSLAALGMRCQYGCDPLLGFLPLLQPVLNLCPQLRYCRR